MPGPYTLSQSTEAVTRDTGGQIVSKVVEITTYRMPDRLVLSVRKETHTAPLSKGGGKGTAIATGPVDLTSTETKTNTWEDSTYDQSGKPTNQPLLIAEETVTEGYVTAPAGQQFGGTIVGSSQQAQQWVVKAQDQTVYAYDTLRFLVYKESVKRIYSASTGGLRPNEALIERYRQEGPEWVHVQTTTFQWNESQQRLVEKSSKASIAAGQRPGGVRSGSTSLTSAASSTGTGEVGSGGGSGVGFTVTWAQPADIDFGTPLGDDQLNATADVPGTFAYNPPAGTILQPGTHTLSVVFVATGLTSAIALQQITVLPLTPSNGGYTLEWDDPADIAYPTALSGTQLDAVASVSGTFDYAPAAGTVLAPGDHELTVTFTPDDWPGGGNAQASVSITVTGSAGARETPVINWDAPAAIPYGAPLGKKQLNATVTTVEVLGPPSSLEGFVSVPSTGTWSATGSVTAIVTAYNESGETLGSDEALAVITDATQVITWEWSGVTGATAYNLYRTEPGGATVGRIAADLTVETYDDDGSVTPDVAQPPTVGPAGIEVPGTLTYSPPSGTRLNVGTYTLTVTFTPDDTFSWVTVHASVSLTVTEAPPAAPETPGARIVPSIDWTPGTITAGVPIDDDVLNATAYVTQAVPGFASTTVEVPGTFEYAPAIGATLPAGPATLVVTFTPADSTTYALAIEERDVTVAGSPPPMTPVIVWDTPAEVDEGTALSSTQLNAAAFEATAMSVPVGLVGFVSAPGAGGTWGGTGTVSAVVTGVDAAGNESTASVEADASITNTTQKITWTWSAMTGAASYRLYRTAPAAGLLASGIAAPTYEDTGAAVGAGSPPGTAPTVAAVPGTFTYTPSAGTILTPSGSVALHVFFEPDDESTWATATDQVSIQVEAATVEGGSTSGIPSAPITQPDPHAVVTGVVDADPTAPSLEYANSNLDLETLQLIYTQISQCSGLWQHEYTWTGLGVPWLKRGTVVEFTGLVDEHGTELTIPAGIVLSMSLTHDESKGNASVTRELRAQAWTTEP